MNETAIYKRLRALEKELEQVKDVLRIVHERFIRMRGRFALLTTLHRAELAEMGIDADVWLKEMKGWPARIAADKKKSRQ